MFIYVILFIFIIKSINKNLLIRHKQSWETKFMINDSKKIKGTSDQINVFVLNKTKFVNLEKLQN